VIAALLSLCCGQRFTHLRLPLLYAAAGAALVSSGERFIFWLNNDFFIIEKK